MGCIVQLRESIKEPPPMRDPRKHSTNEPSMMQESSIPALTSEIGRTFFFLKGAESVMMDRVEQRGSHWLQVGRFI